MQHAKEEVDGKTLLVVANFPRKQIGPRMSDCLITGVQLKSSDEAACKASTVMVQCSHAVQPGLLVTVTGSFLFICYYSCWDLTTLLRESAVCETLLPSLLWLVGHAEQLASNARDLSWNSFTSANILVGTVIELAGSNTLDDSDHLSAHQVVIDFGKGLGPQTAQAVLSNRVFTSIQQLLSIQLLAVTNLNDDGHEAARVAVLTVGGLAVLQPAKHVANGYKLA